MRHSFHSFRNPLNSRLAQRLFFIFGFCLVFSQLSYAQLENEDEEKSYRRLGNPSITNFNSFEYKGYPQNFCIKQDKQGLIYIGNQKGVLQYDGSEWQNITIANYAPAISMASSEDGTIFVGAKNDLGFLAPDDKGQMKFQSLVDKLPAKLRNFGAVWNTIAIENEIFFQTDSLFIRYKGKSLSPLLQGKTLSGAFAVGKTLVVMGTEKTVYLYDYNTKKVEEKKLNGSGFDARDVRVMLPITQQTALAILDEAVGGSIAYYLDLNGLQVSPYRLGVLGEVLKGQYPTCGSVLQDKSIAIGTSLTGIYLFNQDGKLLKNLQGQEGRGSLQDNHIKALYQSSEGTLWAALDKGVSRIDVSKSFSYFNEQNGLQGTLVQSLLRHDGAIYASTGKGVFYRNPLKDVSFKKVANINAKAYSLCIVGNDLLAVTDLGVYQIRNNTGTAINDDAITGKDHLSGYQVLESEVRENLAYIAHSKGLALMTEKGAWQFLGKVEGLNKDVRRVVEMKNGNLWLLTGTQELTLLTFESDEIETPKITVVKKEKGLDYNYIKQIYPLDGSVLVATDKGLFFWKESEKKFEREKRFGEKLANASENMLVTSLRQTDDGKVWLYARNDEDYEVSVYNPQTKTLNPITALSQRNLAVYSIFAEKEGLLWLGCDDRLIRYNLNFEKKSKTGGQALIRRVESKTENSAYHTQFYGAFKNTVGYVTLEQSAQFTPYLDYNENSLKFSCALPNFGNVENTEFSYSLENEGGLLTGKYVTGWSKWTKHSSIEYLNLPSGDYVFKVKARNAATTESAIAQYNFTIVTPFYLKGWALIVYVLMLGGLGYVAVRVYTRRLEAQNKILEDKVNERTAQLNEANHRLSHANEELKATNEQLSQAYEEIRVTNEQLEQQKQELQVKNQKIKEQQDQLVQAERMTAVTEILPILAHEINTPLRSMLESVRFMTKSLPDAFKNFAQFVPLLGDEKSGYFWKNLQTVREKLQAAPTLNAADERALRRKLENRLEDEDVEDADIFADKIVKIGAYELADDLIPLLKDSNNGRKSFDMMSDYGQTFKQLSTMDVQIQKISKKVKAMNGYYSAPEEKETLVSLADGVGLALELYEYYIVQAFEFEKSFDPAADAYLFPVQLTQIWSHLIMNMVKLTQRGKARIRIEKQPDAICVEFSDNRTQPLTEREQYYFNTGRSVNAAFDNADDLSHIEIRLSISRKLAESFGGRTLILKSVPGETVFQVVFPLGAAKIAQSAAE